MSHLSILAHLDAIRSCVLRSDEVLVKIKSPRALFDERLTALTDRIENVWLLLLPNSTTDDRHAVLETVLRLGGDKRDLELNYETAVKEQMTMYERSLHAHLKRLCDDLYALIGPLRRSSSPRSFQGEGPFRSTSTQPLGGDDEVLRWQEQQSMQLSPSNNRLQAVSITLCPDPANHRRATSSEMSRLRESGGISKDSEGWTPDRIGPVETLASRHGSSEDQAECHAEPVSSTFGEPGMDESGAARFQAPQTPSDAGTIIVATHSGEDLDHNPCPRSSEAETCNPRGFSPVIEEPRTLSTSNNMFTTHLDSTLDPKDSDSAKPTGQFHPADGALALREAEYKAHAALDLISRQDVDSLRSAASNPELVGLETPQEVQSTTDHPGSSRLERSHEYELGSSARQRGVQKRKKSQKTLNSCRTLIRGDAISWFLRTWQCTLKAWASLLAITTLAPGTSIVDIDLTAAAQAIDGVIAGKKEPVLPRRFGYLRFFQFLESIKSRLGDCSTRAYDIYVDAQDVATKRNDLYRYRHIGARFQRISFGSPLLLTVASQTADSLVYVFSVSTFQKAHLSQQ
ncbi:hypothetical protein HIM_12042 [Hirsutella minnesotensis 3608]|uniref:Uncharacterized protein n=1 Tax=Hirsutella minnesotensis 3608 TaxID=1043627 RepID=A0A0F7ZIF8_9HYPO|nr:hypothetical protein HIM_12042 [Hirsutella minnesotensis 3608]